ncbi:hypothetical protein LTR85_010890 [Meristemomyces frigidus]|nr:hypothetical protein LTR85_010890 [Meristemomyces frigidus]
MDVQDSDKDMADILFQQLKKVPRELRDLIYEFILTEPTDIIIPEKRLEIAIVCATAKFDYVTPKPALLGVCKQIRDEASPVYFAVNTFRAITTDIRSWVPFAWIMTLPDDEKKAVRKLVVECRVSESTKTVFNAALEEFRKVVPPTSAGYAPRLRRMIEKVKGLADGPLFKAICEKYQKVSERDCLIC